VISVAAPRPIWPILARDVPQHSVSPPADSRSSHRSGTERADGMSERPLRVAFHMSAASMRYPERCQKMTMPLGRGGTCRCPPATVNGPDHNGGALCRSAGLDHLAYQRFRDRGRHNAMVGIIDVDPVGCDTERGEGVALRGEVLFVDGDRA
jgi:hypothetical protein